MQYKLIILVALIISILQGQTNPALLSSSQKGSLGNGTQYWTKGSATGFDFGTSTDFSIILQIKTYAPSTLQRAISKKTNSSGGSDPGFMLELRNSRFQFNIGDATTTAQAIGTVVIQSGVSYFVVVTAQRSGSAIIYTNGVVDNSVSISTIGSITNALTLGIATNSNGANPLIGIIGQIQVVSGKVFSASEVLSLYTNRNKPWLTKYSTGTMVLNVDWSTPGYDMSGSSNHVIPTNAPIITRYQ